MKTQNDIHSSSLRPVLLGAAVLLAGAASGCAVACEDDGLLQENCPAVAGEGTDSDGESASGDRGDDADAGAASADGGSVSADGTGGGSADDGGTDPDGDGGTDPDGDGDGGTDPDGDGDGATDGDGDGDGSDDAGSGTWCVDGDGDGFGDPDDCTDEPGGNTVDNGDDCDDGDADTHPGAAEHEDADACVTDADGDGWGDAAPGPGITPGADCWDGNADLNPTFVTIGAIDDALLLEEYLVRVATADASLEPIAGLQAPLLGMSTTGTAMRSDGHVFSNDSADNRLREVEYAQVCTEQSNAGQVMPAPQAHGVLGICGLAFDDTDTLWAIDGTTNTLRWVDEGTGLAHDPIDLTMAGEPLDIDSCGMTWDCHEQRLLLADIEGDRILEVDRATGVATLVADVSFGVGSGGLSYEPVERVVYAADGSDLTHVPLDGSDATHVGNFHYDGGLLNNPTQLANLAPVVDCAP